ncbi:aminodeoxychorismate synthase component I [Pseudomonas antarctica]|uniref:aminodeoxychorismate synthase component I n=1 Tax=Pseudomonas antarctica TaxID=219572 RepID=UPI00345D8CD8
MPLATCDILEVPYASDPTIYFELIHCEKGAVLLDSGQPSSSPGRYDIMSAWPVEVLIPEVNESAQAFFVRAQKAILGLQPAAPPSPFSAPFTGGILGYLAYDFSNRLDSLTAKPANASDLPDAHLGVYLWALVTDHLQSKTYFVFHPNCAESQRELATLTCSSPSQQAHRKGFKLLKPFAPDTEEDQYRRDIEQIHRYILAGDCYQVNYAQRYQSTYEGDPWVAYQLGRAVCPTPFSAYLALTRGAICSHSPERFLSVKNRRVETRPIKGTRHRHPDVVEDLRLAAELRESPKDRAENVMIVDLLRNDLGRVCRTGSVKVTELFEVETYPNVHHLVSAIEGELAPNADVWNLFEACFPGGSITGAPKIRAMEIIEELERQSRSVYCGSVFYLDCRGHMDSSITIRTLLFDRGSVFCWGGGGIIHDSSWQAEYLEVGSKVEVLLRALESTLAIGADQFSSADGQAKGCIRFD